MVGQEVHGVRELAFDRLGVGVEEELGGIATQPVLRIPGAVDAVAVPLAGADLGDVDMPHPGINLGHRDAHLVEFLVEQAQSDRSRDRGVDCEVGTGSIKRGAQGVRLSRSSIHRCKSGTKAWLSAGMFPSNVCDLDNCMLVLRSWGEVC